MTKKILLIALLSCLILSTTSLLYSQTVVGGHVKMILSDYKSGESDGEKSSESAGMALREFDIYISQEITDKISVETATEFSVNTSATPGFGKPLKGEKNMPDDVTDSFSGWREFKVKINLPKGYELSTGILHPEWSWEYGGEKFWEEEINGSKFGLHHDISAVHEAGFEIYKSFELENMSLPAYLWITNGHSEANDNNNAFDIGLKLQPELGAFKFEGGIWTGKWDDAAKKSHLRWIAGVDYTAGNFNLRSEIGGAKISESVAIEDTSGVVVRYDDSKPFGYIVKGFYHVKPWWKVMLAYDYVKNDNSGGLGEETYTTITPGLIFDFSPSAHLIVQGTIADWKRTREPALLSSAAARENTLKFNRIVVGWRITF
jgi:hypothetical protein